MELWKTLSRRSLLQRPPFLVVEEHCVELPDGQQIPDWCWVKTPDFVNVVAVTTSQEFLFFRQTKYALKLVTHAIVGGYIEGSEDPEGAARRELLEETGYRADTLHSLGSYCVDPNRGVGNGHLFLATGCEKITEPTADDLEEQELSLLPISRVKVILERNEMPVLSWSLAVSLALGRLETL